MVGKTVLVAGGAAGIGRTTASALAAVGTRLAIAGRDHERAEEAAREIRTATGAHVDVFIADLSSQTDVLINNVGGYWNTRHAARWASLEKRTLGASERNETKRRRWHRLVTLRAIERFVFIDESGANLTLARRYGRALRKERCGGSAPRHYPSNLTLTAALTIDGMGPAMVLDGAVDGEAFRQYVEHFLLPTFPINEASGCALNLRSVLPTWEPHEYKSRRYGARHEPDPHQSPLLVGQPVYPGLRQHDDISRSRCIDSSVDGTGTQE